MAILVAVAERGQAAEEINEAVELDPQRSARGRAAPRPPAALELDVEADLYAALEQRAGSQYSRSTIALISRRPHLDRLQDPLFYDGQ